MQGQATVLLVSVGQEPTGLNNELTRLGVAVLPAELHDCEELIDEHEPDLVVLFGARGAMELASLIEGHEGQTPPRMVIAADRRDLAKMVGLNRDVVVSLFATESGDRVLGQRIESLARRAAKRRSASLPPPPVKATSLGLPTAGGGGVLGRLELKKSTGVSKPEAVANAPKNEADVAPSTPVSKRVVSLDESPEAGLPNKEDAGEQEEKPEKTPAMPQPADRASSTNPPKERQQRNSDPIEVSDSEFLSLRPSEFPEEDLDLESIPAPASLPGSFEAGSSSPASKDEVLNANAQPVSEQEDAPAPLSEFDVSSAEAALDNLESLLAQGGTPQGVAGVSEEVSIESEGTDGTAAADSHDPDSGSDDSAQGEVADGPSLDESIAQQDEVSTSPSSEDEPAADAEQHKAEREPSPTEDSEHDFGRRARSVSVSGELGGESPPPRVVAKKRKGGLGVWLPGLLVAAAAGAGIYMGQKDAKPTPETASPVQSTRPKAQDGAGEAPDEAPEPESKVAAEPPNSLEETTEQGSSTATETEQDEVAAQANDEQSSASSSPLEVAARPFVVEDTKKPTCEDLLNGQVPPSGPDIEHDASVIWDKARKLIVRGKIQDAHRRMCEAVAINPSSAAVEGLAGLHRDMFSLDQAEYWAKKAEELRPGQREMALLLGDVYGMRGEVEKAKSTWLEALKLNDDSKSQLRAMSRDYSTAAGKQLVVGDYVKAEIWYRRAAIIDDQNFAALMGLANTFMRTKRPNHALAFAYRVLDMSELVPEMQVLVGEVAAAAGNEEEARARFNKALSIRSDFYPAKRGLSQLD